MMGLFGVCIIMLLGQKSVGYCLGQAMQILFVPKVLFVNVRLDGQ